MDIEVKMPDLSTTDAEVTVTHWLVEIGETIRRGQPIVEVETDKAAMEVESHAAGVLKEIRAAAGEEIESGQVIAILEGQGAAPAPAPAPVEARSPTPAPAVAEPQTASKKRKGGLFARNRAAAAEQKADAPDGVALSPAQRTVARRMQASKQTVPHFYLQTSVNADAMAARRAASDKKIAWDAFFVRAAAVALGKFERMGTSFDSDHLVPRGTDAVGVAVDVEGDLFVVPIAGAAAKSVEQVSEEIRAAVEKIRAGDPQARSLRPANLTVTNLGVANVETFVPIINPPESCILAVGKVAPAAMVADDGRIVAGSRVSVTLAVDHRVTSGRYAAGFLGAIVEELESA